MPNITDELRADLHRRNAEHEPRYHVELSQANVVELAAGYVSLELQATFLSMLSWMDEDRRAASRNQADANKRTRKKAR